MFSRIMIPVDLAHEDRLEKALRTGAELSKLYDAPVVYVGVTIPQPSAVAHSPEEFGRKLEAFAEGEATRHGIAASAHTVVAHDPTTDLDRRLAETCRQVGADLVVMGSHIPRRFDFGSHGGALATHTDASVLLVRDAR